MENTDTEIDISGFQTTEELKAALIATFATELEELDITKLRFVMYCRKSTTGDEKQERSIEDQKADNFDAVKRLGINVVSIVEERESAKAPHIRPKFREMIKDLRKGRYNAVLSYHPDRLSRNSLDSGELIWMLEEGVIRSFQFATFSFENSPMGKMLLGMSFVLSKQYTDHLREVVMRGQRRSVLEGRYIHTPKQGYYKDTAHRLHPDGENWTLIKDAFAMRIAGKSLQAITDFLNRRHYTRAPALGKDRNQKYFIDTNRVSELLRDPVYCGVLVFGANVVDLTDIYDFVPMLTVEEFCRLNKISDFSKNLRSVQQVFQPGQKKADLLRGIVVCSTCGKAMSSGIQSKANPGKAREYRYYYRCEGVGCPFKGKSMQAGIVLSYVYGFLERIDITTQEFYAHTVDELKILADRRATELRSELRSLGGLIGERWNTYDRTKKLLLSEDRAIVNAFKDDLKKIEKEVGELEGKKTEVEAQIASGKASIPTYEKYLELYRNLALKAKNTDDMLLKDQIVRKFFLNLIVEGVKTGERSDGKPVVEWKVSGYKLTPLYEKLLESQLLADGRSAGT